MHGLPYGRFPRGWFQIGWSEEFHGGVAKPVRYFGCDLVVFRGNSGRLHALDAHCPHMGAHLGHGGRVVEDSIECPFHGWIWDGSGRNIAIPGGPPETVSRKIPCWQVRENAGVVLLWFDPDGGPPTWEVEPFLDDPEAFFPILPYASRLWTVAMQPQVLCDNAVDSMHFRYVHKAGSPAKTLEVRQVAEHHLHVSQELVYGGDKSATWLTPDGPVTGSLEIELWGVGLSYTHFAGVDEARGLFATTPIDEQTSELRATNWVPRGESTGNVLPNVARKRVEEEFKQTARDIVIWENMRFVERPLYTREESQPYRGLRTWARRFYEPPGVAVEAPEGEGSSSAARQMAHEATA